MTINSDGLLGDLIDRRGFLALSAIVLAGCSSSSDGAAAPAPQPATAADGTPIRDVIVIGAGPAGMTTAYRLGQAAVDYQVLEAAPVHGGRIRHNLDFTDFPIPLGAEWVHVEAEILDEIVNDDDVEVATELRGYVPSDELAYFDGDQVLYLPNDEIFDVDLKFVGSSWLDFFETYVLPSIRDRIVFDTPVTAIDYSGEVVRVTDAGGALHLANHVVVTVPLKMLQLGSIDFTPPLPADRQEAIDEAVVWSGLKAFIEFDEAFYPATVAFEDSLSGAGQRLYYDAAYGQDSDANILGLFSVGAQAEAYGALSDDDLRDRMLAELDEVFDGAASRSYVRHIVQNWNEQPYARAAYLEDEAPSRISRALARAIDGRLHFAGDAYTRFDDWSSVHTAARSAADAVDEIIG